MGPAPNSPELSPRHKHRSLEETESVRWRRRMDAATEDIPPIKRTVFAQLRMRKVFTRNKQGFSSPHRLVNTSSGLNPMAW